MSNPSIIIQNQDGNCVVIPKQDITTIQAMSSEYYPNNANISDRISDEPEEEPVAVPCGEVLIRAKHGALLDAGTYFENEDVALTLATHMVEAVKSKSNTKYLIYNNGIVVEDIEMYPNSVYFLWKQEENINIKNKE